MDYQAIYCGIGISGVLELMPAKLREPRLFCVGKT